MSGTFVGIAEDVPPDEESSVGFERRVHLRQHDVEVHPVDGGRRDDEIEAVRWHALVLRSRGYHLGIRMPGSQQLGKARPGFDGCHAQSGFHKRTCCLARARAEIERDPPWLEESERTQPLPQRRRIRRPRGCILIGARFEVHRPTHVRSLRALAPSVMRS